MKNSKKNRRTRKPNQETARKQSIKSALAGYHKVGRSGKSNIIQPSEEATRRYNSIPLLFEESGARDSVDGRITFDSWQQGDPVSLRDVTDGHLRRVTLKAGPVSIELVAEKTRDCWEFIARVYSVDKVCHDFVIKVGRRKLLSDSGGYYHWSSKLTPGQIELLSFEQNISFERLSWR